MKLVPDPSAIATTVECPTCCAWVGWACGESPHEPESIVIGGDVDLRDEVACRVDQAFTCCSTVRVHRREPLNLLAERVQFFLGDHDYPPLTTHPLRVDPQWASASSRPSALGRAGRCPKIQHNSNEYLPRISVSTIVLRSYRNQIKPTKAQERNLFDCLYRTRELYNAGLCL